MKFWIWMSRLNVKPIIKYNLIKKYKEPKNVYKLTKEELLEDGIELQDVNEILENKYKANLENYIQYLKTYKIEMITINDNNYPKMLKNIYDPPIALYIKGNKEIFSTYAVGMVGCRNCSIYGKNTAQKLAYDLAKNNFVVVSGLAKGIDTYSHVGCLAGKGKTIAVLGNGLDTVYPFENKELADKIVETGGAVISEYIIGTKPLKQNFPQRNRIISGLSNSIIVVEAKERSGTMITVNCALEQGREIYAVPGNITSINSAGTNELIKQGAKILTNINDINF